MSQENKSTNVAVEEVPSELRQESVYGKRYVGARELITLFITGEISKFSVESYLTYFLLNIFQIDSRVLAAFAVAQMTWDIVNDSLFAYLVDRTRTRFGKFKPWAFATIGPYAVACIAMWLTPLFVGDNDWGPMSWQKITIYAVIALSKETLGTLYGCAVGGLNSTYTPSIDDKAALIALDNIGDFEKVPKYLMVVLLDLVAFGVISIPVQNVYMGMGIFTLVMAYSATFVRIIVIKERIVQVEEKPKVTDGLRNFFGNRLQVCVTLSNFLFSFGSVSGPFGNLFWLDVIGSASLQSVVGIPASPITYISYALLPKFRKKFTMKQLWFMGNLVPQVAYLIVFIFGFNHLDNLYVILPLMAFHEVCISAVYSISHTIPSLMAQEVIDYGEWKTGKRTEAMTGFISGLATKLVSTVQSAISTALVSFIGYEAGIGKVQKMKTKQAIFAMYSIVPILMGALGYIPMLFYNLNDKTRAIMYHELEERRKNIIIKSQMHTFELDENGNPIKAIAGSDSIVLDDENTSDK